MGFVKSRSWKVDRQLLPLKVHYFIFFGALGCVLPFRTVFATQLGISATAVGTIFLAVPFLKILTNPFCGLVGDYFKRFRLIIAILVALVAASHLAMVAIPPFPVSPALHVARSLRVDVRDGRLHASAILARRHMTEPADVTCPFHCTENCLMEADIRVRSNACALDFDFYSGDHLQPSLEDAADSHFCTNSSIKSHRWWSVDCSGNASCVVGRCLHTVNDTVVHQEGEFLSPQLWGLFLLMAVSSTSFCAVMFLIDAVCYELLQGRKTDYGQQRIWGTLGWAVGSFFGGYLNEQVSPNASEIDYSFSFYLLAALLMVDLIPVSRLKVDEIKYSSDICKDVALLLSKPHIVFYLVIVLINGVLSGLIWNYQFLFLQEIGSSQMIMGLSQVTECLAEVPCFLIAEWVVRKIGYTNCNSLTLFVFGLRYLALVYMTEPWMVLPLGIFNGPAFGIYFAAITMFGKKEAPPGTEATIQSLISMVFEGVGCGVGSVLGGVGFDNIGSRKTFMCSAIASFVSMAINIVIHIFKLRKSSKIMLFSK